MKAGDETGCIPLQLARYVICVHPSSLSLRGADGCGLSICFELGDELFE